MRDDLFDSLEPSLLTYAGEGKKGRAAEAAKEVQDLYKVRRLPVLRYALSLCRNSADAEDIAQETFFRLFLYLAEGHSVDNTLYWLFTVTRRLVLDRIRRPNPGDHKASAQVIADAVEDPAPSIETRVLEAERLRELYRLINQLTGAQRECVLLRARGVSFQEISEILGMPRRAAVYHTEAALQHLKRKVKR